MGLAQGLINAIPILIAMAPGIIQSLLTGLLTMIPQIILTGIELIGQLALGLVAVSYTHLDVYKRQVVFLISFLKERGIQIRESLGRKPLVIRWAVYGMLVFGIPMFGYVMTTTGGFIYAQF